MSQGTKVRARELREAIAAFRKHANTGPGFDVPIRTWRYTPAMLEVCRIVENLWKRQAEKERRRRKRLKMALARS